MTETTPSTGEQEPTPGLPVSREGLLAVGLTDEQIDEALSCPPRFATPPPSGSGVVFDAGRVVKALRALRALRHTKTRRWQGKPLEPDPWQVVWILAPTFGYRYIDDHDDEELAGTRVVRTLWVEVPRKQGKSTLASGVALILLAADGEPGAEVYAAASTKGQAMAVAGDVRKMALASPQLRSKLNVFADHITTKTSGGVFRALSKVAEAAHGLNVHGAVVDEVHVHKSRDLVDAIETGTGARDQPLVVFITTADDGSETSIYAEKHGYIVKLAQRVLRDESHYGVIWAAGDNDDPFDEATWRKANPGLGRTLHVSYLAKEAKKAREEKSYYPTFLRLHLNVRQRITGAWLDMRQWGECGGLVVEPDLAGRACYGGIDLANSSDFTAWVLLFAPQADGEAWRMLARLWVPEAAVNRRKPIRPHLLRWARDGWLTITEGDVTDDDTILAQVRRDAATFDVREVAYDPWNERGLFKLQDEGLVLWPLQQSLRELNGPCRQLERWLGQRQLCHGNNPVMRWMASNAIVRTDANGNIAPDKRRSEEKIDGISALVDAIAAATRESQASAYEQRGLEVV